MKVLLLQGANMEALGRREPELYGTITADELDRFLIDRHPDDELDIRYTNVEGEAIGWIYEADTGDHDGLVMNPAGVTRKTTPGPATKRLPAASKSHFLTYHQPSGIIRPIP